MGEYKKLVQPGEQEHLFDVSESKLQGLNDIIWNASTVSSS
jgi:hypothetical protein